MMDKRWQRQHAFTLVELMVVLVILAILATAILPNVIGKRAKAMRAKAQTDIAAIETLLAEFYLDMGRYPTSEEGLRVLYEKPEEDRDKWSGPYPAKPIPKDPWGNPYLYWCPGINTSEAYEVASYGKDGQEDGEGEDADVVSWVQTEDEY